MKVNDVQQKRDILTRKEEYIHKVYAGWLGKVIGVRHGSNIEQWTYDRIEKAYGEISGYLFDFKNFAADDDTNGPMFFLRALEDYTHTRDITPEQMGKTWLNYAGDGHGFYWWGGYGQSTENTAYQNLKHGVMAPRSGSIEQNGKAVAEQIGGQIFIDVWGLIAPGQPKLAAEYAEKIASVSHDGNGKYGGMFIAACIAEAFEEADMESIIGAGLSVIPDDCEYATMTRDIIRFYKEHPENWRDAFQYVYNNYGYDRYPGVCHIIPNSAVIILSLLYGEGEFSKSINICNMCGWDTDCNVANVGTILGVKNGLEGIEWSWREPINDFLCCSSVIGTLNMLDIPWCASYIADLGFKIAEVDPPASWADVLNGESAKYHFEYPDSTHAFRVEGDHAVGAGVEGTKQFAYKGTRSLKVRFDRVEAGSSYRTYVKTYYTPEDFNDSRYDPSFSPTLYPGQMIEAKVMVQEGEVKARLYIRDRQTGKRYYGEKLQLEPQQWQHLEFPIPRMENVCIEEAGVEFIPMKEERGFVAYLDQFDFQGLPDYSVQFQHEQMEKWNDFHLEVSQFTYLRGLWRLEDGELSGSYAGESAETYTGDLQWKDYHFHAEVVPKVGEHHRINFRVQGGIRSYAVGFAPDEQFVLYKNDNGYKPLVQADFQWEHDQSYFIEVEAKGSVFTISVDGKQVLKYEDDHSPYLNGQIGFSNFDSSHTHYKSFKLKGLSQ